MSFIRWCRGLWGRFNGTSGRGEPAEHLLTGEWGERVAVRYLRSKRYRILGRRIRIGRGEIDIIARDGDHLVFVEVKTRSSDGDRRPADAVDAAKRRMLARTGIRYISRMRNAVTSFRFDIIEVKGERGDRTPVINHIMKAFDRRGNWR